MGITKIRGLFVVGLAAVLLAGCASKEPDDGPGMDPGTQAPAAVQEPEAKPEPTPEPVKPMVDRGKIVVPLDEMSGNTETLTGVFHFDFDQAIVKRSGHSELNRHAKVLSNDSMLRVRLEGHADERGTREYNLALGERRANAIRAYLVAQGASRSQVEVISYGEEKPLNSGHSESSWAQNRRVEIVYR
jgi:peptidoglycan-associated lipoprotein